MVQVVKQLTRSRLDRVFGGVCGGFATYIGIDAAIVRVLFVAMALFSAGAGLVVYLLAWLMIPLESSIGGAAFSSEQPDVRRRRVTLGVLLAAIGLLALISSFLPVFWHWSDWRVTGPIVMVLLGFIIIFWRSQPRAAALTESTIDRTESADTAHEQRGSPMNASVPRRLVRVQKGRKIAGICTGLGAYFDVDPTLVRLLWVVLVLLAGTGILLYLILWLVMPLEENA